MPIHRSILMSIHTDTPSRRLARWCRGQPDDELCIDMRIAVCIDMCINMCTDMCANMCTGMCMNMCTDMCMNMCIDMCTDMCIDSPTRIVLGGRREKNPSARPSLA